MTMTDPSETNRIIAEFMGWTDWRMSVSGLWARRMPGSELERPPRYFTSADAVLPVVERLCRERGLAFCGALGELAPPTEGDEFIVSICEHAAGGRCWIGRHKHFPSAAALACAAVIGAGKGE